MQKCSLFVAVLLAGTALPQSTIYVDVNNPNCPGVGVRANPYCSIQTAILAASNNDTVLVMPGVYNENLDFLGKAIVVRGQAGAQQTVIDAGFKGSGVKFVNKETNRAVLSGFTIRDGIGSILPNTQYLFGGGVFCLTSSPTLEDLILENNRARFGGGVAGYNTASPLMSRVQMRNNFADVNGGGACFWLNSTPVLEGCLFQGNSCNHTGGGLNTRGPQSPTLLNCIFDGNTAKDMGGAIRVGALAGCILVHCTFFQNSCPKYGGAVAAGSDTAGTAQTTHIRNCIFWNNQAPNGPELSLNGNHPAIIDIAYCDVCAGLPGVFVSPGFTLNWGAGMLDADPAFVDPANGDLHLALTSPCLDRCTAMISPIPTTDFEGDPRNVGIAPDMGADEFHPHLYHNGTAGPGLQFQLRSIGCQNDLCLLVFGMKPAATPASFPGIQGLFFIDPAWILPIALGVFPTTGSLSLPLTVPPGAPRGMSLPTQALIGLRFSNLHSLEW